MLEQKKVIITFCDGHFLIGNATEKWKNFDAH